MIRIVSGNCIYGFGSLSPATASCCVHLFMHCSLLHGDWERARRAGKGRSPSAANEPACTECGTIIFDNTIRRKVGNCYPEHALPQSTPLCVRHIRSLRLCRVSSHLHNSIGVLFMEGTAAGAREPWWGLNQIVSSPPTIRPHCAQRESCSWAVWSRPAGWPHQRQVIAWIFGAQHCENVSSAMVNGPCRVCRCSMRGV